MKKYFLTIVISLLIGFLLSNYMIKEYDSSILVFNEKKTVYLIQQGVYSSIDSMKNNTSKLTDYIYDFDTFVKTTTINDQDLISYIEKYDLILKQTNDTETIGEIVKNVLKKYKGE